MGRGFTRRGTERQQLFLPVWRDSESGEHRNAHDAFCYPHLQVEAVQEDDGVDLVAQVAALPLFEALLDRWSSPSNGFSALRIRRLFAPDRYVARIASSTSRVRRWYRAEAPNQVWSWDITKLRGPVKWTSSCAKTRPS